MSFNKDRIFIVDNVAPEWLHKSWLKKMEDAHRWHYGMAATREDYGRFFVLWVANAGAHRGPRGPFAGDHGGIADYFNELWQEEHLPKLIPDAGVMNIQRVHFNGQFPTDDKLAMHIDWDIPDMWTMVYYLDGEDGDTIFYSDPEIDEHDEYTPPQEAYKVKFKKNRAIFFPSYYWHAAENPTRGFRVSLAFNYLLNRNLLNEQIRQDRGIDEPILPHPDLTEWLEETKHLDRFRKLSNQLTEEHEETKKSSKK